MSELLEAIKDRKHDGVLFKANYLLEQAGEDVHAHAEAVGAIAQMLSCVRSAVMRDSYLQQIAKKFKIKPKVLKDELDNATSRKNSETVFNAPEGVKYRFPKGVSAEEAYEDGFYAHVNNGDTGFYFQSGMDTFKQQSNFVFKPLMHVMSKSDNKRMIEVINAYGKVVVDMPSRHLITLEQFKGTMFELSNNLFWGNADHLMKLWKKYGSEMPVCYELKTLGWQPEGFFAYSNGIVTADGFVPMDDKGTATYDGTTYYSPSASTINKKERSDDDDYENDRYLFYTQPPINFEEWCRRMVRVYTESNSGMIGVAYVMMSLFRDVVFSIDNNSPHLSAYGEKGSGKSKFNESLSAFFFNGLPPLNLFHSTDFAFANRISRYTNCLVSLDEFNDNTIKPERFEAVKAAYDGTARERGKGTSKNKTEILKVHSALALAGQYLSTADDNAALTRCIILAFKKRSDETARLQEDILQYEQLKTYEKQGISGMLVELLKYRKEFEKEYVRNFPERFAELRAVIGKEKAVYNERVMRNYCALLTCVDFFKERFALPFTYEEFFDLMKREIVKLSTLISESDSLADFWNTVVYLLERGDIYDGFHFKIETVSELTVKSGKKTFGAPVKLLFLRLTTIHKLYMEAHRRQGGKNGVNLSTIELYLSTSKGYVGKSESGRFTDQDGKSTITSSYVFDYAMLGVPLEQQAPAEKEEVLETITGKLWGRTEMKHYAGAPKLHYTLAVDQSYMHVGARVEKVVFVKCYDEDLENESLVQPETVLDVTGVLTVKKMTGDNGQPFEKRLMLVRSVKVGVRQIDMGLGGEGSKGDVPF